MGSPWVHLVPPDIGGITTYGWEPIFDYGNLIYPIIIAVIGKGFYI